MKNTTRLIILCLIFSISASAQHKIPQSVIGNGGAVVTSSSHRINGTVGQNFIGIANSNSFSNSAGFWYFTGRILTVVEQLSNILPVEYRLEQNYPNPFNPGTTIRFDIPKQSFVTLKVYNMLGEEIMDLINEEKNPGIYNININAGNLASGVYFYRITARQIDNPGNNFISTKKLMLVK